MNHTVTPLLGGRPTTREPHIWKPSHDRACICCGRPFETYVDQPDSAERKRLDVQSYPFALPEKKQNDQRSLGAISESCADGQ